MLKALSDMTVSHDKKGFMSLGVFLFSEQMTKIKGDKKYQKG